jgi:hypothetical protein
LGGNSVMPQLTYSLNGAELTRFFTDEITEAWIDFRPHGLV